MGEHGWNEQKVKSHHLRILFLSKDSIAERQALDDYFRKTSAYLGSYRSYN